LVSLKYIILENNNSIIITESFIIGREIFRFYSENIGIINKICRVLDKKYLK